MPDGGTRGARTQTQSRSLAAAPAGHPLCARFQSLFGNARTRETPFRAAGCPALETEFRPLDRCQTEFGNEQKRRTLPVPVAEDDRHDRGLARVVALHGRLHLLFPAEVRSEDVRADEQENHVGLVPLAVDLGRPLGARHDLPVRPHGDLPLALEQLQVRLQFGAQRLVLVRIADEGPCSL